jgi:hypothetical protein
LTVIAVANGKRPKKQNFSKQSQYEKTDSKNSAVARKLNEIAVFLVNPE